MLSIDRIGIAILLGLMGLALTFFFKRELLKGWGWAKAFAIGGSIYAIISSGYFAITGDFFWNDDMGFYRFIVALGAIVYIGVILDFYGVKFQKKKKKE